MIEFNFASIIFFLRMIVYLVLRYAESRAIDRRGKPVFTEERFVKRSVVRKAGLIRALHRTNAAGKQPARPLEAQLEHILMK